jgi:hypothetical protein
MGGFAGYFSLSIFFFFFYFDPEAELGGQTCFGFLPRRFSNSRQRAVMAGRDFCVIGQMLTAPANCEFYID